MKNRSFYHTCESRYPRPSCHLGVRDERTKDPGRRHPHPRCFVSHFARSSSMTRRKSPRCHKHDTESGYFAHPLWLPAWKIQPNPHKPPKAARCQRAGFHHTCTSPHPVRFMRKIGYLGASLASRAWHKGRRARVLALLPNDTYNGRHYRYINHEYNVKWPLMN